MSEPDFQQSDTFDGGIAFEGNVERDTVIYRALDLGNRLLTHCFGKDKVRQDFEAAVANAGPPPEGQPESIDDALIPMASLGFGEDGGGLVLGKNRLGEDFLMIVSADSFQAVTALLYDEQARTLTGGALVSFDGRTKEAADMLATLAEGITSGQIAVDEGETGAAEA